MKSKKKMNMGGKMPMVMKDGKGKMKMGGMMTGDKFLPTLAMGADMAQPMEMRMKMGGSTNKAMIQKAMKAAKMKRAMGGIEMPKRAMRGGTTKANMKMRKKK
jgi:hypothetical protein